jgi:hypothetical protein
MSYCVSKTEATLIKKILIIHTLENFKTHLKFKKRYSCSASQINEYANQFTILTPLENQK